MNDNVRMGRESITKKISFHQKHARPYKTIQSIEKVPTKKKITLNEYHLKKESNPFISQHSQSKMQRRKIKSLSKYELKKETQSHKKRSLLASEPELAIDGMLNRNMHMVKFSISKERDRLLAKQSYKRSEQVRSVFENKKMSSISKYDQRDDHSNRNSNNNHSIDTELIRDSQHQRPIFKQLDLETIINPHPGKQFEVTLQDLFEEGCYLYYKYLNEKEAKLLHSQAEKSSFYLKQLKEELGSLLQEAHSKFKIILDEVGELSYKNVVMLAIVNFQQNRFAEAIMYLSKALQKTEGNLFLVNLPGPEVKPSQSLTFVPKYGDQTHHFQLNFIAYLYLAESFKHTKNYLCAVNVLKKCESSIQRYVQKKDSFQILKQHYQTLQPKESEELVKTEKEVRMKKKSYLLTGLQPEMTTNKFKKYSHSHNFSSIELNKQKKYIEECRRNNSILERQEQENLNEQKTHKNDSVSVLDIGHPDSKFRQIAKHMASIYLLLARLYVKIKNYDFAIVAYKKCIEIQPLKIESLLELASIYYMKHSSKKALEWLETCIASLQREECKDSRWELDYSYIKYHKGLILLQQKKSDESYVLFSEITSKELASEVNYYKGAIKLKSINYNYSASQSTKNAEIEDILMNFNQAISACTSKQYLVKSYFHILLILVFEKKDYYGAQYEVNRFKKIMPIKATETPCEQQSRVLPRIAKIYEDEDVLQKEQLSNESAWNKESYFNLLFDLIDGVICILKMKINKGILIFKEVSLKVESNCQQIYKYYGFYYQQIIKLLFQFKFYAYYILRQYQLSLKHVNKLIDIIQKQSQRYSDSNVEIVSNIKLELKLIVVNKLMLECMILMKQSKFNYAMSKLTEIEAIFNQPSQTSSESTVISSALIINNFNMVKSICFINLYSQLEHEKLSPTYKMPVEDGAQDNNKQILLSAEELLRHCLISDKENSLIHYLISVIYYELQQYEASLKYIRQALQFSDDHMIKHYFSKANTKFMLGRYEQAIKDYANAIIVHKEQLKNDNKDIKQEDSRLKTKSKDDTQQQYYMEKQLMFNQIYLNRAIAYIKYCYELSANKNYNENANVISSYKMKACQDLLKYFNSVIQSKSSISESELRNRVLLLMHTDDPGQVIEVSKLFSPKLNIIKDEETVKVYYIIKELNNCIVSLRSYIVQQEHRLAEREQKNKKEVPPKYKKISISLPKRADSIEIDKFKRLNFDLKCLESLKKSSNKSQGSIEQALISLLEMTEQIYRKREEELNVNTNYHDNQNFTLERLFSNSCGEIFKWSDILFFIGVIHFELKQFETAIKYFEQSYNEKKNNGTLYSLSKYIDQTLKKVPAEQQEEYLFEQLEPIFENRVYSKEEIEYNIGVAYLMLRKYKQAYYYLQDFPHFLMIIKKAITVQTELTNHNEFLSQEPVQMKSNRKQILIDDDHQPSLSISSRQQFAKLNIQKLSSKRKLHQRNDSPLSSSSISRISRGSDQPEDNLENITPFPTHNRLCSIYSPKVIEDKKFYLSFCLPKVQLPLMGIFHETEIELGRVYTGEEESSESSTARAKDEDQEAANKFKVEKRSFESMIRHISLVDLEMKPIAPWIRQNNCGVIFTENLINESIELKSERCDKRKEKNESARDENTKRTKKERYAQLESRK